MSITETPRPDVIWRWFADAKPNVKKPVLTRTKRRTGTMKYQYTVCSFNRPYIERPDKFAWDYWVYHTVGNCDPFCNQLMEIEDELEWADLGE